MDTQHYAAKQHLHKYRQALLRILSDVTDRPLRARSIFDPTVSYTVGWEEVGVLALTVWELSALEPARFDAHPQWEAAANETIRFLSEHCAGCGRRLTALTGRLCPTCLVTLDAPMRHRLYTSIVVRQIEAYIADLTDSSADDTGMDHP